MYVGKGKNTTKGLVVRNDDALHALAKDMRDVREGRYDMYDLADAVAIAMRDLLDANRSLQPWDACAVVLEVVEQQREGQSLHDEVLQVLGGRDKK